MSFTVSLRHSRDEICSEFTCPCKNSPLAASIFTAAQIGDLFTVKQRLERNPKLATLLDTYGYSTVHYAAQNGHFRILQTLLSHGAIVDGNRCGATPLHRAGLCGMFVVNAKYQFYQVLHYYI
ncbi:ankyrin repeat domain-containing protein [archaeon]|nr:MAG: ankyrin repeat domain-containing protein [archaeon]